MTPSKNQGRVEVKVDFNRLDFSKQLHTKQQWTTPPKNQGRAEVKVDFNKLDFSKQLHTKQQWLNKVDGLESREERLHSPEGLLMFELPHYSWSVQ